LRCLLFPGAIHAPSPCLQRLFLSAALARHHGTPRVLLCPVRFGHPWGFRRGPFGFANRCGATRRARPGAACRDRRAVVLPGPVGGWLPPRRRRPPSRRRPRAHGPLCGGGRGQGGHMRCLRRSALEGQAPSSSTRWVSFDPRHLPPRKPICFVPRHSHQKEREHGAYHAQVAEEAMRSTQKRPRHTLVGADDETPRRSRPGKRQTALLRAVCPALLGPSSL